MRQYVSKTKAIKHSGFRDICFIVKKYYRLKNYILVVGDWCLLSGVMLDTPSQSIKIRYSDLPKWFESNTLFSWKDITL